MPGSSSFLNLTLQRLVLHRPTHRPPLPRSLSPSRTAHTANREQRNLLSSAHSMESSKPYHLITEEQEEENDDDACYEHIEAPKFVDLTSPAAGRPPLGDGADASSWFCLRIGCDQNHEQVDPEALHRAFVLRVMAARSPNVVRRNQSLMPKCPRSVPARPPRSWITRLSTATAAAKKVTRPKVKDCPIGSQRASPTARVEASNAKKKALTTPKTKSARPVQDPFLSAKHRKEPVVAAGTRATVVKALFMATPKKESDTALKGMKSQTPVSEGCSKMRKLKLACREVPSRYLCQLPNKRAAKEGEEPMVIGCQESVLGSKKMVSGRSARHDDTATGEGKRNECNNPLKQIANSKGVRQQEVKESSDENKENLPNASLNGENSENVDRKVPKVQSKVNAEQGGKLKQSTNLKPFRFRTDERGALKEANSQWRQMFVDKDSAVVPRNEDGGTIQMGKCADKRGPDKPISTEKQRKERTRSATDQLVKTKLIPNSLQCNNLESIKGKSHEKSQKILKVVPSPPPSRRTMRTARNFTSGNAMRMPHLQLWKEGKTSVKTSRLQAGAA